MNHNMLQGFVREYAWIHLCLGIIGNVLFVVGSAFFFYPDMKTPGVWLFLFGSLGMLMGRLGEAIARGFDHHWRKQEVSER